MSCSASSGYIFDLLLLTIVNKISLTKTNIETFEPSKATLLCVSLFIETFTIIAAIFRRDLLAVL